MFQRILVPTDGSDITKKAVDTAIRLAQSVKATILTISVKEPFPYSAISEMQRRNSSTHRNASPCSASATCAAPAKRQA